MVFPSLEGLGVGIKVIIGEYYPYFKDMILPLHK